MHFSETIFQNLTARGIGWVDLTLHVGLGTFRPMDVKNIADHVMHSEWAEISAQAAAALNTRRASGGRVVAVGTTSARTLETAAAAGAIQPFTGQTGLFIRPGHVFRGLDALITNFHLPRSSLLVLVSATCGNRTDPRRLSGGHSQPLPVLQLRRRDADPLTTLGISSRWRWIGRTAMDIL